MRAVVVALCALPGDLYGYEQMLPTKDQQVLGRLRDWLAREVAPIANDQWARTEFPHHLIPSLGDLGVIGLGYDRPSRLLTDVSRSRWRCAFAAQRRHQLPRPTRAGDPHLWLSACVSLGYEAVIAEEDVDTHEQQIASPRRPEVSAIYQDPTLALGAFLGVAAVQADVGVGGQDVHPELSRLLLHSLITLRRA